MLSSKQNLDPSSGAEILARSIETNNVEQLRSILATGVDVDATNSNGTTALMRAASRGQLQMVRALVSYGADPNRVRHDKFSALALAAFFGHADVVKFLVENGANRNTATRWGTSPQMWASARTFRLVAQYLGNSPSERPTTATREDSRPGTRSANRDRPLPIPYRKTFTAQVAAEKALADNHTSNTVVEVEAHEPQPLPTPPIPEMTSSVPFSLRLALSISVLLLIAVSIGFVFTRNQRMPPTTIQPAAETARTTAVVENTVTEAPKSQIPAMAEASINSNHSDVTKAQVTSTPKHRLQRPHSDNVSNNQGSTPLSREPKVTTQVATGSSSASSPVKPALDQRIPKQAPMTTQLLNSVEGTQTKRKVIQWP